jgi:hypothetical protein
VKREYFGYPGHFICADRCKFHVHTHVNGFCVSTVGMYYVRALDMKPTEVGHGRLFETMVFPLGPDGEPSSYSEMECAAYNDAAAADAGHEKMVRKYERKSSK